MQPIIADGSRAVLAVGYHSDGSCQSPLWSRPLGSIPLNTVVQPMAIVGAVEALSAKAAASSTEQAMGKVVAFTSRLALTAPARLFVPTCL